MLKENQSNDLFKEQFPIECLDLSVGKLVRFFLFVQPEKKVY